MRRAGHVERHQTVVAADAVIDMDHQIALGDGGRFAEELFGATALLGRTHQPVTQDVLLADHRHARGAEPVFEAERGERRLGRRQFVGPGPALDRDQFALEPMLLQHPAQAFGRTRAPSRHDHAPAGSDFRADMGDGGV